MSFKRLIKYFSLFILLTLGINISIANTNTYKKVGLNFLSIDYDSPTTTDIIFEPTDPFDVVSVIKEDGTVDNSNTIPYILLLKDIVKDKEKIDHKKLMVVLDVASLFLGVGEFKAALTSTTALAKAYRAALASADLAATTTDVACQDSDSEVCEQWKEISGFVLAGVVSASSIDLTYQSFKNSPKMQNRVMGLRDAEGIGRVAKKTKKIFGSARRFVRNKYGQDVLNQLTVKFGKNDGAASVVLQKWGDEGLSILNKTTVKNLDDVASEIVKGKTMYRHIDENANYLSSLKKYGEIPSGHTTYITLDKFDDPIKASGKMQLPPENNGVWRIEFEGDQLVNKIQFPNGKFNNIDYKEVLTRSFPEWGEGGATQFITTSSIKVKKMTNLKTGKVINFK